MLTIFDLDQTLVERYTTRPLPGVRETLARLSSNGAHLTIATNQAGPAWRLWTGKDRFPTAEQARTRLEAAADALPVLRAATWLVAVYDARVALAPAQFEQLAAALREGNSDLDIRASADPTWRKPEPGMLWEACRIAGIQPEEARFIGDMDSDARAAAAAGMPFYLAGDSFHFTPHEDIMVERFLTYSR